MSRWFQRFAQVMKLKLREERRNADSVVNKDRDPKRQRIVAAALKQLSSEIQSEVKVSKLRSISEQNLRVKVALDCQFQFDKNKFSYVLVNIMHWVHWFTVPLVSGPVILMILGIFFKIFIVNFDSVVLMLLYCFLVIAVTAGILVVKAWEKKYNILPDNEVNNFISEDEFHVLSTQIDWNVFEPEVQSVHWLNSILAKYWSLLTISYQQRYLEKFLDETGNLKDSTAGFTSHFIGFQRLRFTLGNKSPLVTGIRVLKRGVKRNQVIIDLEITYDADFDILFVGYWKLNFGIEKFYAQFIVRIVVGPLIRETPTVATISCTLFKKPVISWKLTGLLRFLNQRLIQSFIEHCICALYRNPHKYEITVAANVPNKEIKLPEPLGVFRVDVVEATQLPQPNFSCCGIGKTNAYCEVRYEQEKKKTQVIADSDRPEWQKSFIFLFTEAQSGKAKRQIEFLIFDEDFDRNELIGSFVVSVDLFRDKKLYNGRMFITTLREPNSTQPVNKARTKLTFRISYFSLKMKIDSTSENLAHKNLPLAVLCVLIDYATGLETIAHRVKSAELRSLVRVSVGNQAQVTSIQERTGYPVWEESLNFFLYDPRLEDVHIEIVDMYHVAERKRPRNISSANKKDSVVLSRLGTVVGYVTLPVANIVNAFEKKTDNIYRLEGMVEEGHMRVMTSLRFTVDSPAVIQNQTKARVPFSDDDNQLEEIEENEQTKKKVQKSK